MRPDGGATHLRREADVATYLAQCGAPVLGPSPLLPAGPHERDGRWMTFWPHIDHDDSRAIAVEEAAALLRQVHEALAGYDGELPLVAPVLVEVPQIIATLEEQGAISASDADALRGAWSALAPEVEALGPIQALHGDAHVGNMLVPRGGEPLWSDFEDACVGPVAWDLACLRFHSSAFGDRALEAYGTAVDDRQLELCLEARRLQSTAWTCLSAHRWPEFAERAEARLATYR